MKKKQKQKFLKADPRSVLKNERIYAVVDWTKGDCFESIFFTYDEAKEYADYEWYTNFTKYDKKRRTYYAIMRTTLNEDGGIDYNKAEEITVYFNNEIPF